MFSLIPGWKSASFTLRAAAVAFCAAACMSAAVGEPITQGSGTHNSVTQGSSLSSPTNDLDAVFKDQACVQAKTLTQLDAPIARLAKRLDAHDPVTIVAIGSSSTGGAGASSAAFSYPSRLERELRQRFPSSPVTVINRGINGEDAADMMKRMDEALQAKPDLVIWQLGTNTLLRDGSIPATSDQLQAGIAQIRKSGADILLIDPQFAPRVNAKPAVDEMVGMIAYVAKANHVPLFRRYVAMRHWHDDNAIAFERFISADGLHMNDWGYSCLARLLADNIAGAVARSRNVADVKPLQ